MYVKREKTGRLLHDAEYKATHPEVYVQKNREKVRRWASKHPEERAKRKRCWHENNPEKVRMYGHRRRSRKRGNGGNFTEAEWTALKVQYGNVCLCCRRTESDIISSGLQLVPDHVHALVDGGPNDIGNIQPLCHGKGGCNNRKGAKHIDFRIAFDLNTIEAGMVSKTFNLDIA